MEMSFFVMPLYMHISGPDNRDLIGGAYNSYCHVVIISIIWAQARDLVSRA